MGTTRRREAHVLAAFCLVCLLGDHSVAQNASPQDDPDPKLPDKIAQLKSPDASTRQGAAMSLGNKDPRYRARIARALPALHEALDDPEPFVRMYAARAIGMIDPDDPTALPVLLASCTIRMRGCAGTLAGSCGTSPRMPRTPSRR